MMKEFTFGMYKGSKLDSVPSGYLDWCVSNLSSAQWRQDCSAELERREKEKKKKSDFIEANLDNPEVLVPYLEQIFEAEVAQEIEESGCEHEYNPARIQREVNARVAQEIAERKAARVLDSAKERLMTSTGMSHDHIAKVEKAFWDGKLAPERFSSPEIYQAVIEYVEVVEWYYDGLWDGWGDDPSGNSD